MALEEAGVGQTLTLVFFQSSPLKLFGLIKSELPLTHTMCT